MAGTVRRRGRGWQALLNFRDPATGRVVQFSVTKPTKREAERALAELVLKRDEEKLARANQTFADAVVRWREAKERTLSPSSLSRYDIALRVHLLPTFGTTRLSRITSERIDRYYAALHRDGLADNTILWLHNLLSNIFRYAVRTLKWVDENPVLSTNPPRRAETRVNLPNGDELAALIAAADDDGVLFGTFVRLAISTGARRGELCALQWKHIDLTAGSLVIAATVARNGNGYFVKRPKNGRVRRLALPAAMVEHLSLYRDYRALIADQAGGVLDGECYVFDCDPTGRRVGHPGTMSDKFQVAKRVAKVREVRMHDLRHQAATVLLNSRISPRVVAERLGHSRTSTTLDIYAQFVPAADQEAADVLGALLERPADRSER